MSTILRVEHPSDSKGPWHSTKGGRTPNAMLVDYLRNVSGPPPDWDPGMGRWVSHPERRAFRFGVRDNKELTQWFDQSTLQHLDADGFMLREYEADPDDIIVGASQVAIRNARLIGEHKLIHFIEQGASHG